MVSKPEAVHANRKLLEIVVGTSDERCVSVVGQRDWVSVCERGVYEYREARRASELAR